MWLWCLFYCFCFWINCSCSSEVNNTEKVALKSLYDATGGEYWKWDMSKPIWNFTDPTSDPCLDAWQGITCLTQNDKQHVSGLRLYAMSLAGTLPDDLSLLINLQSLDLSQNKVYLTLPSALGALTLLNFIDISDNQLTGAIPPELRTLEALTIFDASFNFFSGSIPVLPYASMTALQSLKLNDNNFTGQIAPEAFVNCTNLLQLNIYKNRISGSLPHIPTSLARFSMHENELSGTIPPSFFRGNLEMLDLYVNFLSGSLPQSITNAIHLHFLSVDSNLISGSLPQQWTPITTFQALQAGGNFLSGPVPEELFEQTSLSVFMALMNFLTGSLPRVTDRDGGLFDYFNAASNFLTGPLPISGGEDILMLANNFITGSISPDFFTVDNDYIDVSNNILTGTIPSSVGGATGLYNLILSQNSLSGTIPDAVYSIPTLAVLAFAENEISGTFPTMNSLTKLNSLVVTDNLMYGTSPSLSASLSLENLGLGHNLFSGSLPSDVAGRMIFMSYASNLFDGTLPSGYTIMSRLQVLDVSDNFISGAMYSDLSNNNVLYDINVHHNLLEGPLPKVYNENMVEFVMSSNKFSGTLPNELARMRGLRVLLLQDNRLAGSLDRLFTVSNMTELQSIDLSDNAFTGYLPDALFQLPKIETIALVKNCFRTKLPRTMCDSKSLRILALDGLAAGRQCRSALWDPFSLFGDAYFVEHAQHSIPSCIFEMNNLTTLHLSGNGLTGNIESLKLASSSKLTSLSLSHNQLTGTIPRSILNTILDYIEFDISYNRFSGTCSSDNNIIENVRNRKDDASVLSIEVNRLSGDVPGWMNHFANVRALSGNMFQCSKQSDLPSHDPDSDVYICGSGELDSALWVLFVACIVGMSSVVYVLRFKSDVPRVSLYEWIMNPELATLRCVCHRFHENVADTLAMKYVLASMMSSSMTKNNEAMVDVRLFNKANISLLNVCRVILCAILTIVLPCILLLKFLSSGSDRTQSHQYRWLISATYMSGTASAVVLFILWAILIAVCACMIYRRHSYIRQVIKRMNSNVSRAHAAFTLQNYADYIAVVTLNTIVVCVVNGAYIYVQLKDVSQSVQIFSQVSLAGFKLVWDTFAVGAAISWISSRRLGNFDDRSLLYTALLVFNNIIAPCFVTAVTDDTCFKGFFESASVVSVTYVNAQCSAYDVDYMHFIPFCSKFGNTVFTTSYIPPFNYNYQCSSAILKSFVPVFVYAYAFMILALPVMDYLICCMSTERIPALIRDNLAGVMWPSQVADPNKPLIRVDRIISTLMRHLAVLLTFGFAYPLLGVGVVIAMLQYVWKWRLLLVRFVAVISIESATRLSREESNLPIDTVIRSQASQSEYLDERICKLNDDSKDAWRGAYVCLWAVLWPGSVFVGCILFDIMGDEVGWRNAIWMLVATILLPLVYLLSLKSPWVRSFVEFNLFASFSALDETVSPVGDVASVSVLNEL